MVGVLLLQGLKEEFVVVALLLPGEQGTGTEGTIGSHFSALIPQLARAAGHDEQRENHAQQQPIAPGHSF